MEKSTLTANYIITIVLALFVMINFGIVGTLVFGGFSCALGTCIILIGLTLSYLIFRFIKNVIIKNA